MNCKISKLPTLLAMLMSRYVLIRPAFHNNCAGCHVRTA